VAFYVKQDVINNILLPEYLYMWYLREEFDRYMLYKTYGSATLFFNWDNMCELEIELPSREVQQKYVNIYKALVASQQSCECGLDDIKLICDGYIENLRRKYTCQKIGPYLEICEEKNSELRFGIRSVRGVSIEKKFIETKADMTDVDLSPYYLVRPNEFTYVTVTSRNGGKISIAMNDSDDTYICSSSYVVFRSKNTEILYPGYLMLFFLRPEFDRKARFCSWGSAREIFEWSELCELKIPIPEIGIQKAIAEVYSVYSFRKKINDQLKDQIKNICPILIKGSLEEGK
jgi:type I restriction enzyme S subunit